MAKPTPEGEGINEFVKTLGGMGKQHVKVQVSYATCTAVDWDKKTMTATGVIDDLPWYGVRLGLGSCYRKPAINAMCLIGMIENQDAAAFLIDASVVEEVAFTATKLNASLEELNIDVTQTVFNGGNNGGLIKIEELKNELAKYTQLLQAILSVINVLPGINEPGNGAPSAFQAALKTAVTGKQLPTFTTIENTTIKH